MIFECSQGDVIIDIPEQFSKIGIKLSGGIDSSLILYLLAKYKKYERPEIKIIPFTGVIRTKPFQLKYATRILDKVCELHDVNRNTFVEEHYSFNMETKTLKLRQHEELVRLYNLGVIDNHFWGVTMNPPTSVEICNSDYRDKSRDPGPMGEKVPKRKHKVGLYPFEHINKRGIREIYENEKVIDKLFPLTRSCELENCYVFDKRTVCRRTECWWCQERFWGFGSYE